MTTQENPVVWTARGAGVPAATAVPGRLFRVLATCTVFEPGFRGGGPVRSVARIVDTVPDHIDLALVTSDRDLGSVESYPGLSGRWVSRQLSRVFYLHSGSGRQWLRLWRDLRVAPVDLLYVNSLWHPVFTVLPILAARLRLIRAGRVLIAPRGELSPGALSLKSRKKRLFLRWWAPFLKRMEVVWHATTDREAADILATFPWAKIEVSYNQVSLPREPIHAAAEHAGAARLVFIGRVSPMKNLEMVLRALQNQSKPVEFDIYGPLEDAGYWKRCLALIDQMPHMLRVTYRGELAPAEVPPTFSRYDAFVFPTLGENFGHVIAESLSASCPVICSGETPWTDVLEGGGGAVVHEVTAGRLGREIERFATMTPAERLRARYAAGRAYRAWREGLQDTNIIEQARRASWAAPALKTGSSLSRPA